MTATWWKAFTPPPDLTVSEWADAERRLSPEASAEPGRWDTSRAEYQRGIMDAASDKTVEAVVIMSSAQIGKTEIVNNLAGFYIDQDPSPILVLQPTIDMGKTWSKDRLAPMLRDTPALQGRVADVKSRDGGNTILHKTFPGGRITIAGANAAASLSSRPVRVFLADEVDRYPLSAGTEGDPVSLGTKRTTTFWNRKIILVSTPTVKGQSRIEAAYEESDQRRYYVPCPHCEHEQTLKWAQVKWPEGDPNGAEYACEECGSLWSDVERWRAVSQGRWQASRPSNGVAGFHLNELYSPWVKLAETAKAFLDAKKSTERLQTWVNTALGETWEEKGERLEADSLKRLAEVYGPDDLPDDVIFATAGVDTQGDRLEVEVVGWGAEERSTGILYAVLHGDPAQNSVWSDLDDLLLTTFHTASGRPVRIEAASVDSGGHHTEAVHRFTRERFGRRVYSIAGKGGQGVPAWPVRGSRAKTRDTVFLIGVDTIKDMVTARWKIDEGEASCRIPADPELGYDDQWMAQQTAEERVTRYKEGRPYTVWVCPKNKRNEAFDCRVYATAALKSIPSAVRKRAMTPTPKPREPAETKEAPSEAPAKSPRPRRRGNDWLGTANWRL